MSGIDTEQAMSGDDPVRDMISTARSMARIMIAQDYGTGLPAAGETMDLLADAVEERGREIERFRSEATHLRRSQAALIRERDRWERLARRDARLLLDAGIEVERLRREREVLAAAVRAEQRLRRAHERHSGGYQILNSMEYMDRVRRKADETREAALALLDGNGGGGA